MPSLFVALARLLEGVASILRYVAQNSASPAAPPSFALIEAATEVAMAAQEWARDVECGQEGQAAQSQATSPGQFVSGSAGSQDRGGQGKSSTGGQALSGQEVEGQGDEQSLSVYVTNYYLQRGGHDGEGRFHIVANCAGIRKAVTPIRHVTLTAAVAKGLTPCMVCHRIRKAY